MNMKYHQIYRKIKKFNTIVIARHIGPDPDALGSTLGLKAIIEATFPKKKVYVVGAGAARFKYIGTMDKFSEELYENSLLIALDTPDMKRVDGVDASRFKYKIKIDHHPFVEEFCDIEWVDSNASSASQMVMELAFSTRLKMTKEAAEKLYIGLIADTERFLFEYTTPKTFKLVSKLIEKTQLNFTDLYLPMYMRPISEIKFQAYLMGSLNITENGFGYVKIDQEILDEYEMDSATPGNMINSFNYIEEMSAWGFFTYDKVNNNIRGSIRSRGPIINEIAADFGGGGHIYASGVKLENFEIADELIDALDGACEKYNEEKNNDKVN
jgi:Exopolyphosphatase-related proteins